MPRPPSRGFSSHRPSLAKQCASVGLFSPRRTPAGPAILAVGGTGLSSRKVYVLVRFLDEVLRKLLRLTGRRLVDVAGRLNLSRLGKTKPSPNDRVWPATLTEILVRQRTQSEEDRLVVQLNIRT